MWHLKFVVNCVLVFSSIGAFAQDSARSVQYHSQDIVPIRAKVKYTTLIELPTTCLLYTSSFVARSMQPFSCRLRQQVPCRITLPLGLITSGNELDPKSYWTA